MKESEERQRIEQERINRFGHVRPEIAMEFQGYKFVAVGSKLFYRPSEKCRFFTDMLLHYVPVLFGREWFEQEVAKPRDQRHPVMQWRVKGMNFMNKQPQLPDGSYGGLPTGPLLAYLTFAYDLYIVEHNGHLDPRLLERLKHPEQFQGARHELFAEATCLRAGFDIQHENEADGSCRHAEFVATHRASGQQISVEAKSKHRPGVMGQPGSREAEDDLNLRLGKLLNNAVRKNAMHPLVVFMDVNMPYASAERILRPGPLSPSIANPVDKIRKAHGGKDPINLLVITNHPEHYTGDEELPQRPQLLTIMSTVPLKPATQVDALAALHQAANLYGNIPVEFPSTA